MTDIIERLRALSRADHDDLSVGAEAADEIERLRRALEDRSCARGQRYGATQFCTLAVEAIRERDRLRAALHDLMALHDEDIGMDDHDDDESVGWYSSGDPLPLTFGVLRRARAALNGEGE